MLVLAGQRFEGHLRVDGDRDGGEDVVIGVFEDVVGDLGDAGAA
jgi:hypothetical protein